MMILPYNPQIHEKCMESMLEMRGMDLSLVNDLPSFGLVALDQSVPVAAGFVRKLEGGFGVLDSFITNPTATAADRNKTLSRITTKLIKIAEQSGIRALMAFTKDDNTATRALNQGFSPKPHKFFILNTKDR